MITMPNTPDMSPPGANSILDGQRFAKSFAGATTFAAMFGQRGDGSVMSASGRGRGPRS